MSTWSIAIAFGVCTLGVFFAVPAIAQATEDITGVANAGKLIAHVCAILWCAALQITMVDLAYRAEYVQAAMFQRSFAAMIELAIMVPLFVATNKPHVEFTTAHVDNMSVASYLLVYLSYVLFTCGELAFMCAKTAQRNWNVRPWSGAGFALSSMAATLGMAYTVSKGSYIIFYTLDDPWPLKVEEVVSPALSGLAILFLFLGLTLPMVGSLREQLRQRKVLTGG
ncbi:hypothetical protein ACIOEZ_32500 [Streptomyces sp. NPDC087866]|uniref:hypothetical protein n=1 Tax=Streptomyces sp. NPDC087866 TaxID=3365815 RepID=UPI0037F5E69B